MADFVLTDRDGREYDVTAPDARSAYAAFKKMQGGAQSDSPLAPTEEQAYAAQLGVPGPSLEDLKSLPGRLMPSGNIDAFKAGVGELINHPSRVQETLPGQLVAGAAHAAISGFKAPGDAVTGKLPVFDANGQPTDEAVQRGLDMGIYGPGRMSPAERRVPPVVPTQEELRAAARDGYNAVRDSGVDYHASAVTQHAQGLRRAMEADGLYAELAPKAFSILSRLESAPAGAVASIQNLDAARKALRNAARDFTNPTEQLAAQRLIDGLDDFIRNPSAQTVVDGTAAGGRPALANANSATAEGNLQRARDAAEALDAARGNHAARKRSQQLTDMEYAADLNAGASHSGANGDNALRQRAAAILKDPKKRAGYSPEEIASLEEVALGTRGRNATRWVGNFLGGGGGLGALLTGGAGMVGAGATGNLYGAAAAGLPIATGVTAKNLSARMTARALRGTDELVRTRSPLYEERMQAAGVQQVSPDMRAALARALAEGGIQPGSQ